MQRMIIFIYIQTFKKNLYEHTDTHTRACEAAKKKS